NNLQLRRMRAICYRRTENYPQAIIIYHELLREYPHKEEYLRPLLFCLRKLNRHEEADRLLAAALDYLEHPSVDLYLIFGVSQYRRGRFDSALRSFRDAQEIAPRDWRVYRNMAEVYRRRGLQGYADRFEQKARELKINA
ncbi:MAG TPA: tetratricopeptide repeat protein, partial [Sediminispirochaeta sp.]|nr:tetratricopeptide repeat protein [Sediminispirochaeta sp.]